MVQSADTRQWEQQVRIPVVPTADLTKSSTQSGAGFINCTFYDVEDSFGKRTFVNKRPGFQYTSLFTGGSGRTGKTSYGLYWTAGASQYIGSNGAPMSNQFGQVYATLDTSMGYQSFDIGVVRNGSVELRGFRSGPSPNNTQRWSEFEFRTHLRSGAYTDRIWKNYVNENYTFGDLQSDTTSMYPIGMVCYDVIATGSGPYGYDFHQWVALTGGLSVTDAYG